MTKDIKVKDVHEAIEEARKICKKQQLKGVAHYGNYATLNDVFDSIMEALEKNNMFFGYNTYIHDTPNGSYNCLQCTITHKPSGSKKTSELLLDDNGKGPQGMGGAITYYRRYILQLMLNLDKPDPNTEDDASFVSKGGSQRKRIGDKF